MIQFQFSPDQAKQNLDRYFNQIRQRILEAAKDGMGEAMRSLAFVVISRMGEAGIRNRTGLTAAAIASSPKVWINNGYVKGTVNSWAGNTGSGESARRPMGLWLGAGVNEPAVEGKLMAFFSPEGKLVFTRKRRAYQVPGHGPFMNEALQSYEGAIVETIRARVMGALAG